MIANAIATLFQWIAKIFIDIFTLILDLIFNLFNFTIPDFSHYSTYLNSFWDLVFQYLGWFRSAFLIGTFEMQIIFLCITIRYTYKPAISLVKMYINWYNKLKVK